jgi:hypothetical protein
MICRATSRLFITPAAAGGSGPRSILTPIVSLPPAACDFLGARLASLLGLDSAKYQYAIDLHRRRQPQRRDDPQVGGRTENRTGR